MCSKMDEVPPLAHFFCFPSFCPLIAFILAPSPGLLLNVLHMSAKWPRHLWDKVKCLSAPSHAVPSQVFCLQYTTLCPPTCPNYTIRIPLHLSFCQLFVTAACYQREKKNGNFRFMTHPSFTLRGRYCSYNSDL